MANHCANVEDGVNTKKFFKAMEVKFEGGSRVQRKSIQILNVLLV